MLKKGNNLHKKMGMVVRKKIDKLFITIFCFVGFTFRNFWGIIY
jgi:hypothetical protein